MFLGIDCGTQSLKIVAMDTNRVHHFSLNYDELSHYKTRGGVHIHSDQRTITAPTLMFVEALEVLLNKMKMENFPFHKVLAISGSGFVLFIIFYK